MSIGFNEETVKMFEALEDMHEYVEKNGVDALKAVLKNVGLKADIQYDGKDLKLNFTK